MEPKKLFNKNYILLLQGHFISDAGAHIAVIAITFWLKHNIGLASIIGIATMLFSLSHTIVSPFGGAFSDSHSRKKIIVVTDLICGAAAILLGVYIFLGFENKVLSIALILLFKITIGTMAGFFVPSTFSIIPDIVPKKSLGHANSFRSTTFQFSILAGRFSGGFLFTLLGAPVLLILDGVTYIFSAISECFIDIPIKHDKNVKKKLGDYFSDMKEGLGYVWHNRGTRFLILLFTFLNFFISPFVILLPFFVEDMLGLGAGQYGVILALFGAGMIIGYLTMPLVKLSPMRRSKLSFGLLILFCIVTGSFGFFRNVIVVMCSFILAGMIFGFFHVMFMTALQINIPEQIRGRVMGVISSLSGALMPLGMGISGIVADLVDMRIPLIFCVSASCILVCVVIAMLQKETIQYLAYET